MLYRTLLKLKERNGLTDDLKNKIDVFFAVGRITEEQYNELMDVVVKEEPKVETNQSITGASAFDVIQGKVKGYASSM